GGRSSETASITNSASSLTANEQRPSANAPCEQPSTGATTSSTSMSASCSDASESSLEASPGTRPKKWSLTTRSIGLASSTSSNSSSTGRSGRGFPEPRVVGFGPSNRSGSTPPSNSLTRRNRTPSPGVPSTGSGTSPAKPRCSSSSSSANRPCGSAKSTPTSVKHSSSRSPTVTASPQARSSTLSHTRALLPATPIPVSRANESSPPFPPTLPRSPEPAPLLRRR